MYIWRLTGESGWDGEAERKKKKINEWKHRYSSAYIHTYIHTPYFCICVLVLSRVFEYLYAVYLLHMITQE